MRVPTALAAALLGVALALAPLTAASAIGDAGPGGPDPTEITVTISDAVFLADRSTLPVVVTNGGETAVVIRVTAWSGSSRFQIDGTPIELEVPAAAQASAEFPATAVSNGTALVHAALVDERGAIIGPASTATITVQAGWETPVVAVFGALVVAVAVIGVVRTVRRARRARAGSGQTGAGHRG